MKAIKKNMKDQILTNDKKVMVCTSCLIEFSGHKGDYFMLPDDHVFKCNVCGNDLELLNKKVKTIYED